MRLLAMLGHRWPPHNGEPPVHTPHNLGSALHLGVNLASVWSSERAVGPVAWRSGLLRFCLCLWWSGVSARGGRPPARDGRRNGQGCAGINRLGEGDENCSTSRDLASHGGPESFVRVREDVGEALTGGACRPGGEPAGREARRSRAGPDARRSSHGIRRACTLPPARFRDSLSATGCGGCVKAGAPRRSHGWRRHRRRRRG